MGKPEYCWKNYNWFKTFDRVLVIDRFRLSFSDRKNWEDEQFLKIGDLEICRQSDGRSVFHQQQQHDMADGYGLCEKDLEDSNAGEKEGIGFYPWGFWCGRRQIWVSVLIEAERSVASLYGHLGSWRG